MHVPNLHQQPIPRQTPIPGNRLHGNPQYCGSIGHGHPAEVSHLHDFRLSRIALRQFVQRVVQRDLLLVVRLFVTLIKKGTSTPES